MRNMDAAGECLLALECSVVREETQSEVEFWQDATATGLYNSSGSVRPRALEVASVRAARHERHHCAKRTGTRVQDARVAEDCHDL